MTSRITGFRRRLLKTEAFLLFTALFVGAVRAPAAVSFESTPAETEAVPQSQSVPPQEREPTLLPWPAPCPDEESGFSLKFPGVTAEEGPGSSPDFSDPTAGENCTRNLIVTPQSGSGYESPRALAGKKELKDFKGVVSYRPPVHITITDGRFVAAPRAVYSESTPLETEAVPDSSSPPKDDGANLYESPSGKEDLVVKLRDFWKFDPNDSLSSPPADGANSYGRFDPNRPLFSIPEDIKLPYDGLDCGRPFQNYSAPEACKDFPKDKIRFGQRQETSDGADTPPPPSPKDDGADLIVEGRFDPNNFWSSDGTNLYGKGFDLNRPFFTIPSDINLLHDLIYAVNHTLELNRYVTEATEKRNEIERMIELESAGQPWAELFWTLVTKRAGFLTAEQKATLKDYIERNIEKHTQAFTLYLKAADGYRALSEEMLNLDMNAFGMFPPIAVSEFFDSIMAWIKTADNLAKLGKEHQLSVASGRKTLVMLEKL